MIGRSLLLNPWVLLGAGLVLLAGLAWTHVTAYRMGGEAGRTEVAKLEKQRADERVSAAQALAKQYQEQAARYQKRAEANQAVAKQYTEELKNANDRSDRTIADLRAGNLRLREQWRDCLAVSAPGQAGAGGSAADGAADDRAASAGRIVRAAAACDAQVRGLQAIIRSDRDG